ncbi:HHIP-like protein 2 [Physella acuta]|uniref:HHIP-like protein 2 n=1 Tax=Physella acuta TaxID=109671 RepID=UPI0027DBDF7B|nr:HHIP-like protein 2 [Physella acuta]
MYVEMTYLSVLTSLVTGSSVTDVTRPSSGGPCYCLQQMARGLYSPVSATFYRDGGADRLLVVEQRGVVWRMAVDGTKVDTFMDIRDRVSTSDQIGENRGLLGVVVDPAFTDNRKVYAFYIRKVEGRDYTYISNFRADNGRVDAGSELFYIRIFQPYTSGNGGPIFFGDDGYLYLVTGDGGEHDDPKGNAQNKNSFHGKVLRIDVNDGQDFTEGESSVAKLYGVPSSNPFYNYTIARPEIFAIGFRNVWGCSQDSVLRTGGTGRIFCAETGTNKYDEINLIQSGRNYGWNIRQGSECHMTNPAECSPLENEEFPIYQLPHNTSHALVGGYVYRGRQFAHVTGLYTFADVITGKIYLLEENRQGTWEKINWPACDLNQCPLDAREKPPKHILAFSQDRQGELYILTTQTFQVHSNTGAMYKLVSPRSTGAPLTSLRWFIFLFILLIL